MIATPSHTQPHPAMQALETLEMIHAELIAEIAVKICQRRIEARQSQTPEALERVGNVEHFAAGVDHAMNTLKKVLEAKLEQESELYV